MAWAWKRRGEWIDFGLGKVNFIHSSCFGSVVECWQHRDVFVLADPAQKHSLASLHPTRAQAGSAQGFGREHSQDSDPNQPKGHAWPCSIMLCM